MLGRDSLDSLQNEDKHFNDLIIVSWQMLVPRHRKSRIEDGTVIQPHNIAATTVSLTSILGKSSTELPNSSTTTEKHCERTQGRVSTTQASARWIPQALHARPRLNHGATDQKLNHGSDLYMLAHFLRTRPGACGLLLGIGFSRLHNPHYMLLRSNA